MIPFQTALQIILRHATPLGRVRRRLDKLSGMTLAEDIRAGFDLPRFDNSAVDGYGVRVADLQNLPVRLHRVATVQAGDSGKIPLRAGETVRIYTGAPVPTDVDAVVMQEVTVEKDGWVEFSKPVRPGDNIRRKGEEFRKGQVVIPAGTVVTPPVVGLLATLGQASALVHRKPRVTLISTGNELVPPGLPLKRGKIYDSNSPAMTAALRAIGIERVRVRHVRDDRESTRRAFQRALTESEVVISLGGVSVGDYDFVKDVAEALDVQTLFWKIAIKPGKPVYFGRRQKRLVFGLPGNPVSALVTYHQLVQPALLKMMGYPEAALSSVQAQLSAPLKKKAGRQEFVRGVLSREGGRFRVAPTSGQDSHMLGGLAMANALIDFPLEAEAIPEGAEVSVDTLSWSPF